MSHRILLIEDEPELRSTLSWFLERKGYEVVSAETGQKALELVQKTRFDVALSDYRMPEMDGFETLRALKQVDPALPVVIVSGFLSSEKKANCLAAGAVDFLAKPFGITDVIAILEKALHHSA